jgi:hypothetical protein
MYSSARLIACLILAAIRNNGRSFRRELTQWRDRDALNIKR